MQQTFEQHMAARIATRNHPEHIRGRIMLRFTLLYCALFVAALVLCRTVSITDLPIIRSLLARSMTSPFGECHTARECIRAILWSARYEGLLLALLLIGGMTLFCESACGLTLSLYGIICGIQCYGSAKLAAAQQISGGKLAFFVCFFAVWAVTALLLLCTTEAVIFSYRYRDTGRGRRHERDALAVRYILTALTYLGTLTVIAAVRAFLLWLIKAV
ncbi:MAG: hypothetical protein J6W14_00430 [Clostridia bacterium]|nr:hypothetical protein [Clostridia bacterium]